MPDVATAQGATSRSAARKLIQAAALAAALVPLGSVQSEATSITCGINDSGLVTGCDTSSGAGGYAIFNFNDEYKVGLDFFNITQAFDVTVSDNIGVETPGPSQEEFDGLVDPLLGAYDCVPLVEPTDTDSGCRRFTITVTDPITGEPLEEPAWDGYNSFFSWLFDSENNGFPNGVDPDGPGPLPGLIRVLQEGENESGLFEIDMCLAALTDDNYPACDYELAVIDPTVKSGNTRFSDQIVATPSAVPEPASIALLGTGLAGLLYRKRRNLRR